MRRLRHPRTPSHDEHEPRLRRVHARRGVSVTAAVVVGSLVLATGAACSDDGEPATTTGTMAPQTTSSSASPAGDGDTPVSPGDAEAPGDAGPGDAGPGATVTTAPAGEPTTPQTIDPALPAPTNAAGLTTAVYWVRPAGDDGPRSLPGYEDPAGPPFPILVYGSVTNTTGSTMAGLRASTLWRAPGGEVRAVTDARMVRPDGTAITSIEAGQTADLVAVVAADAAGAYAELTPELVVEAQP